MTSTIQSLKPNVSRQEATEIFLRRDFFTSFWRMRDGPLRRIADVYVPYWIYRVRYALRRGTETRLFALDAVDGSLDLFEFPGLPNSENLVTVETRNFLPPSLTEMRAEGLLREKVLRVIFQQSFLKLRGPRLEIMDQPAKLHMPYWVGFFEGCGGLRCCAMDAVRTRIEGAKASALFEQWLAA